MNLKCERKVSWILQVTIWSQNIWYWFKRKTKLLLCFKVTKGILIANIFWPFKDHVLRNKINEKADIMDRIRKTITEKLSSQSQSLNHKSSALCYILHLLSPWCLFPCYPPQKWAQCSQTIENRAAFKAWFVDLVNHLRFAVGKCASNKIWNWINSKLLRK